MPKPKMREPIVKRDTMSEAGLLKLRAENEKRTWWTRCWSCSAKIEGTLADLSTSCPHCGVTLRR